jgi:hypothetical protein
MVINMITSQTKQMSKKTVEFIGIEALGLCFINTAKLANSQWFAYKKTTDTVELLQLDAKSVSDATIIIITGDVSVFNNSNNITINGQLLKNEIDKLQKTKRIHNIKQEKQTIRFEIK